MRADFTPGAGPNGGDELLDPGNLAPIAQVEDPPLDGDGPPWLPPEDWTQAREWDAHPQWPWGLSPAERVAGLVLGFLRDGLKSQITPIAVNGHCADRTLRRSYRVSGRGNRRVREEF